MPDARDRLTETELEEIEALAREHEAETYRGPLLALVEVPTFEESAERYLEEDSH